MGEHNGWANYPTWCVAVWIDENEASQRYWSNRAARMTADELAEELKDEITAAARMTLNEDYGMSTDLLTWALEQVDWNEISHGICEE